METDTQLAAPLDVEQLDTAKPLAVIFQPFQTTLEKWEAKATSLVVTDISQTAEMQQARLARLELKEARVTMDKTRKGLVEGLKARTGKIDTAARVIREKMEGLEAILLESEQFAERHAAKVKAELKIKRESALLPFMDTPILGDLSDLTAEQFAHMLLNAQVAHQARIDAAAKAEAEQKAKDEADRMERERVAAENARLKAEAAERERLAEIERNQVEAERAEERRKAEAEREAVEAKARTAAKKAAAEAAKLKAELEAKAKEEAARKAQEKAAADAAAEASRQAAAAPDAAKLKAFAASIRQLVIPGLNNAAVKNQLHSQTVKFAEWVEAQIENL
jgi:hypothetical protein